jgi:hypothetical protein
MRERSAKESDTETKPSAITTNPIPIINKFKGLDKFKELIMYHLIDTI